MTRDPECHCGTCTCDPNMTPAVRFDLSPAQMEGVIRDHLIRLGWTPPRARRPEALSGDINVAGMKALDELLDHIYEYGVTAEGVLERANAFARDILARYAPVVPEVGSAAVAAIQFALSDPDGMTFLRLWNEGEFDTLRREWPNAPREVYYGADPLT